MVKIREMGQTDRNRGVKVSAVGRFLTSWVPFAMLPNFQLRFQGSQSKPTKRGEVFFQPWKAFFQPQRAFVQPWEASFQPGKPFFNFGFFSALDTFFVCQVWKTSPLE